MSRYRRVADPWNPRFFEDDRESGTAEYERSYDDAYVDAALDDDSLWDVEQTAIPPIGSVFILRLDMMWPPQRTRPLVPERNDNVYRLLAFDAASGTMMLDKLSTDHPGTWAKGHQWLMHHQPTFRVLRPVSSWKPGCYPASVSAPSGGCTCVKCNGLNEYAAPNRPDGTYVCFECR